MRIGDSEAFKFSGGHFVVILRLRGTPSLCKLRQESFAHPPLSSTSVVITRIRLASQLFDRCRERLIRRVPFEVLDGTRRDQVESDRRA
jgi:hypothetical protein